ncbi:MAG TPA: hypothetical protein DCY13_05590 [Verrucomicrobiales bacterium]|nr:hypothetical protein [Verrucomicrobiales bacterium]
MSAVNVRFHNATNRRCPEGHPEPRVNPLKERAIPYNLAGHSFLGSPTTQRRFKIPIKTQAESELFKWAADRIG